MQLLTRARAGNVEEALALLVETNLALIANPCVQGLCVFSVKADGGDEKFVFVRVPGTGAFKGADERIRIAGRFAVKTGNNDDFEAEALGLVDGHELNAAAFADSGIGLGEEAVELRVEFGSGGSEAIGRDRVQQREEDLGVLISCGIDAGRTAEGAPGAFDPGGEGRRFRLAPAQLEGAVENLHGAG